MSLIPGKYQHYKNENIDDYFTAIGVPYVGRKLLAMSSPTMEITLDGNAMSVNTYAMLATLESSFKLDEEYEEKVPTKILKSKTTLLNDREFETISVCSSGLKQTRLYSFTEDECVMTLTHEKTQSIGKRYFHRIK